MGLLHSSVLGTHNTGASNREEVAAFWTLCHLMGVRKVLLERGEGGEVLCAVEAVEGERVVGAEGVEALRLAQLGGRDSVVDEAFVGEAVVGAEEGLHAAKVAAAEELQQLVHAKVSLLVEVDASAHRTVRVRHRHVLGQQQVRVGHLGAHEAGRQAAWQLLEALSCQSQLSLQHLGRPGHLLGRQTHPRVRGQHAVRVHPLIVFRRLLHLNHLQQFHISLER